MTRINKCLCFFYNMKANPHQYTGKIHVKQNYNYVVLIIYMFKKKPVCNKVTGTQD